MKLLADLFPIIIFFVVFKFAGLYIATAVAIAIALLQLLVIWIIKRKLDKMLILTAVIITVLGAATLLLHDEMFIKWKPTAVNWIFAAFFIGSQFFGDKPLMQRMLEDNITLPSPVWTRVNLSWAGFFILLGALNLVVVYHFSTDAWVNFKLFGMLGLTLIFAIIQALYMAKYIKEE